MLVTYVDTCVACSCSSLRDEGGRRPAPRLARCPSGCSCHDAPPAHCVRATRATAAAAANDAVRFRRFRQSRVGVRTAGQPAVR